MNNALRLYMATMKSASATTLIDRTTPVTVVSSAYATSASARPQRLSNGWIVAGAWDSATSYIKFYVSKDNGSTWNIIANKSIGNGGFSLVTKGTFVYCLVGSIHTHLTYFFSFDATTVQVTDNLILTAVESTSTSFNSCSLAINSVGTELHACWSNKNATYPNSFNIRYAKGIINADGSVTWASVQQLSVDNNPVAYNIDPVVVCISGESPTIVYHFVNGSYHFISTATYSSIWKYTTVYYNTSYAQGMPSSCVDNNGVIHIAWHGLGSMNTSTYNILYSKSIDGGNTWSTPEKLTSGNSYGQASPSISVNKNNKIFVDWYGVDGLGFSGYQIRQISNDGTGWSSIISLTNNTTNHAAYPSALSDPSLDFEEPLIIYQDLQSSSVKFSGKWYE